MAQIPFTQVLARISITICFKIVISCKTVKFVTEMGNVAYLGAKNGVISRNYTMVVQSETRQAIN